MAFQNRFLIDECLSPKLVEVVRAGAMEAWHVNHRGLTRRPDLIIARWCVDHDHVLVTNNARDFRRLYAGFDVHPGLAILLPSVERPDQITLLGIALDYVQRQPDLLNKLVEVGSDRQVSITDLPFAE